MKRMMLALLLCVPLLLAQEQILVQLKYISPSAVANLLKAYHNVAFYSNEEMKAVTLSGPKDEVDAALATIRQLDVAPKDIELTVYYMVGDEAVTTLGTATPKDLAPVITQLKSAFTFQTYRLLGGLDLRMRTGQRASTNSNLGEIKFDSSSAPIFASFQVRSASVAPDGSTVRLDGMNNRLRWPYGTANSVTYSDLSLDTDVDIKEGQKVVVGRLGISHDQALFLVLTAKVVN
jgi:hypothetical protein